MQPKLLLFSTLLALQQCVSACVCGESHHYSTNEICHTQRASTSLAGSLYTTTIVTTKNGGGQAVYTTKTVPAGGESTATVTSTEHSTTTSTALVSQNGTVVTKTLTSSSIITLNGTASTVTVTSSDIVRMTTTVTLQSTTTVAEPSGFTPVLDTLPDAAAKKRKMRRSAGAGSLLARSLNKDGLCAAPPKKGQSPPPSYPAGVTCVAVVEEYHPTTITKTVTASETGYAVSGETTVTIVSTAIETITSTSFVGNASSTVTTTAVVTSTASAGVPDVTTTTTVTTTSTFTADKYAATAYAQCADDSNNFAGSLDGASIWQLYQSDSNAAISNYTLSATTTDDTTKEACCSSCAANPLCAASAFVTQNAVGTQCQIVLAPSGDSCPVGEHSMKATYDANTVPDELYILSNGNCGFVNVDGGADSGAVA